MELTEDQKKVRDTRNKNILVSAAAGSGKTKVLVDRIISEITSEENPCDVDRILVVTFTNAAAAEMKERIRKRIDSEIALNPHNSNLRRQSTLIHNAQIRTIDSFCSWVVKNYFYEIDQDPTFRIGSKGEMALLSDKVLDDLLSKKFVEKDESFLSLADAYIVGNNLDNLKKMVLDLYTMAMSAPWPEEWFETCLKMYEINDLDSFKESNFVKDIVAETKAQCKEFEKKLNLAISFYRGTETTSDLKCLRNELEAYSRVAETDDFDTMFEIFSGVQYDRLTLSKSVADFADDIRQLRNDSKEDFLNLKEKYFSGNLEEIYDSTVFVKAHAKALVELTKEYCKEFALIKKKKNTYDFNDIEHMALAILRDPDDVSHPKKAVAEELSDYFFEVMCDEYQDSNGLQEALLTSVCKENNYFTVGDVKQSIYAFRQADPAIFMDKFDSYVSDDRRDCLRIDLDCNFRSRSQVLDFCNQVFEPLMQKDMGGVAYDEAAKLKVGATNYIGDPQMYTPEILIAGLEKNEKAELEFESSDELEAKVIADRINKLFEENFQVSEDDKANEGKKILRPIKLSDIVILARSVKNHGDTFIRVLKENGIMAFVEEETGFFDRDEIQTLLSMLEVIDNPLNDISLASALHSKMFNITTEELAIIRANHPEGTLFEALESYIDNNKNLKLIKFNEFLQECRALALDTPIHDLISKVLNDTGYGLYVSALPMGKAYKANLDKLIDEAVKFESSGSKSISKFVEHINNLKQYEEELGLAKTISEKDDAVRIMTIHKSKGLEFPVVFLARTTSSFGSNKDSIFYHPSLGLGLNYKNPESRVSKDLLLTNFIKEKIKADGLGEEQRILYVALTRAKEKLIIVGDMAPSKDKTVQDKIDAYFKDINPTLSYRIKLNTGNYLEWILRSMNASSGKYKLQIVNAEDILIEEAEKFTKREIQRRKLTQHINDLEESLGKEIEESLAYKYEYSLNGNYKAKYSVSEIKHVAMEKNLDLLTDSAKLFSEPEEQAYIPGFMLNDELTDKEAVPAGALYGTAMHRFLECFDFSCDSYKTSVNAQYDFMKKVRSLSEEEAGRIRLKKLESFMESDLAQRMHNAASQGKLYKEQPFVLGTTVSNLFENPEEPETETLVQGIIDAFFIEDNMIVLLDYKTDKVDEAQELMLRYEKQLRLYELALSNALGLKVKDVLIYSFSLDQTISLGV